MQRVKQVQRKHKESEIRMRSVLFIDGQKWLCFCRRVCCNHSFSFKELRRQNVRFNFLLVREPFYYYIHVFAVYVDNLPYNIPSFTTNLSGHIFSKGALLGFFFKFGKLLSKNTRNFLSLSESFFAEIADDVGAILFWTVPWWQGTDETCIFRLAFAFAFPFLQLIRVNPCICICVCVYIAHVVDKWSVGT